MNARTPKKLFVLDTNVIMHDPSAIYRFHEHDIFIPMIVLEELDRNKKGTSEVSRNARQFSRFVDDLIKNVDLSDLEEGICITQNKNIVDEDFKRLNPESCDMDGRLFFQTKSFDAIDLGDNKTVLISGINDNEILKTTLALQKREGNRVILVSKDINMRIKATIIGLVAEDYFNDQAIEDSQYLYTGMKKLPEDFWERHGKNLESWNEQGRSFYRVTEDSENDKQIKSEIPDFHLNQALFMPDGTHYIVRQLSTITDPNSIGPKNAVIEPLKDYIHHAIWGIKARNEEQNFALNLLLDPNIDFVTLLGPAGTGKTLLALATGLFQVMDRLIYNEIIMTRATIPVGEDIGFLPGTEEEKMVPWMGALMDNLEVLTGLNSSTNWEKQATQDLLNKRIKIRSLNFMRGRTLQKKFLIIDEAQNLTSKQMKTLITRAGPGTKVVCLGNLAQIDTPFLSETTSGLSYVVERFKNWEHNGHITLVKGERSRLSDFASNSL